MRRADAPPPSTVVVQFVEPDGTYRLCGVRVRCAPGNEDGSLIDEMARGVVTPLAPDSRHELRAAFYRNAEALRFIDALPEAVPVIE